jgi:hypothetical protein
MVKDISSRTTFFAKVIFPLLWLTLVGAIVVLGFAETSHSNAGNTRWGLLFFWLGGLLCFCFFSFPLKSVKLDGDDLLVSNYRKQIQIPLSNVKDVSQIGRFVTVTFKSTSGFGKEIRFMTRFAYKIDLLTLGFGEHPVVKELKQRAGIRGS